MLSRLLCVFDLLRSWLRSSLSRAANSDCLPGWGDLLMPTRESDLGNIFILGIQTKTHSGSWLISPNCQSLPSQPKCLKRLFLFQPAVACPTETIYDFEIIYETSKKSKYVESWLAAFLHTANSLRIQSLAVNHLNFELAKENIEFSDFNKKISKEASEKRNWRRRGPIDYRIIRPDLDSGGDDPATESTELVCSL